MNLGKLNQQLSLIANLGILIGLIVIIFELRQTQTAMLAESSSTRAQMMSENISIAVRGRYNIAQAKILAGEELEEEELLGVQEFIGRMLRHFENLHYQYRLGVLDEEIWETNLRGVSAIRNTPLFDLIYPEWPNDLAASFHNDTFVELLESLRE